MKDYFRLFRIKHYIKNVLIFVPLFFDKKIFQPVLFFKALSGVICFSLLSSAVYIINDIYDVEKDRIHPEKRHRPIASGRISERKAWYAVAVAIICVMILSAFFRQFSAFLVLSIYFVINIAYSTKLKNIPIVDISILTFGFVLRIIYGAILTNVEISKWLYYVVVSGAMYMGFGKRRNELIQQTATRDVLKYYTKAFLDKNMYVCVTLVIVFYSLWAADSTCPNMFWTVPIVIIILLKYSLDVEGDSDGDPVEVLTHDKSLILMTIIYVLCVFLLLYLL